MYKNALAIAFWLSLILGLACSPAATPTPVPISTPTPTATMPLSSPTPIPSTTPTPTPLPAPRGKLVIAVADVGPPNYDVYQLPFPYNDRNLNLDIYDTLTGLTVTDRGTALEPQLAISWDVTETQVTYRLRSGVRYHNPSYGEVTAQDAIFSIQRASAPGTRWTRGAEVAASFKVQEMKALDAYTFVLPLKSLDIRWSVPSRDIQIQSKRLFDEKGESFVNLNPMGTGPYKVAEHVADDHMFLEAMQNPWRTPPGFAKVDVLEVPEEATRVAMLKTGEADIAQIGIPRAKDVHSIPGARTEVGPVLFKQAVTIFLAGQYFQHVKEDGMPSGRTPITTLPWVGDPSSLASMEASRKVRWAMSLAVDRQTIIDNILGGLGCQYPLFWLDACHPRWQKKWDIPYDPAQAKKLLAEAGYPNGFEFTYYIPTGLSTTLEEIGEALIPMFEAVGLKARVEKAAYSARRPSMVARTIKDAWAYRTGPTFVSESPGIDRYSVRGTWNPGIEYLEFAQFHDRNVAQFDEEKAWQVVDEFMDWFYQVRPWFAVVSFTDPWAVGPKVREWTQRLHGTPFPRNIATARPAN